MVVSSLRPSQAEPAPVGQADENTGDQVDPNNARVVTTRDERRIAEIVRELLRGRVDEDELPAKDTESYFAVLYQGKNNRWLLRYNVNRKRPTVQFPFSLSEQQHGEITRAGLEMTSGDWIFIDSPEHLLRLPGLIFDALDFVQNDENFRRSGTAD